MAIESYQLPEDKPEPIDTRPCAAIRADLKNCLLKSDCCRVEKKKPRDCIKEHNPSVPDRCFHLAYLFFECKRSTLDNRARFRGRKGYTTS